MKAKIIQSVLMLAAVSTVALTLAGCGGERKDEHAHEGKAGVQFNAKKGLLVPSETAKFIGLQVADVEERKIATVFQFSAQVYRAASEAQFASLQPGGRPGALASGNVSPADAARLLEGQTVSLRRAEDDVSLPGRIVTLKRDLEKASGQVEVLLVVSDSHQHLESGAFVSVTVPLGAEKSVVSVPRSALFHTTEGNFVYTVSGDHFVRTQVKIGIVNDKFAEVIDGLYAGDQIVVQPVMTLWLAELQSLRGGKSCADGH